MACFFSGMSSSFGLGMGAVGTRSVGEDALGLILKIVWRGAVQKKRPFFLFGLI